MANTQINKNSNDIKQGNGSKSYLSMMQLAIMTTIAVASLRSLPAMAIEGKSSIIMYLVPALVFLIPTALIGAELGTTYEGGVYVWIREAFGNRLGFLAIWLQWIQNVVWFPIQLAFVASAFAFAINKGSLSNSGLFTGVVIIVVYWIATLLALQGGTLFAKVSSLAGLIGTLIPAAILLLLGLVWILTKQPITETYQHSSYIPKVTGLSSVVLLVSNVLAYAGMEMNSVHVSQMKNPKKDFTKSMLVAFILILGVFILPTLAMSIAVPTDKLGLTNGIMIAFQTFFDQFKMPWMGTVMSAAIFLGAIASVVTWIAGPSKGLLAAARTGLLPPSLQTKNKHGVQLGILILQGIIVTLLALIYVIVPDVSDVFLALVGMAAALYVLMYLLMFAAAVVLRKKEPNIPRGYKVPALTFVAAVGFVACLLALIMSFVPVTGENSIPVSIYPFVVATVVFLLGIPPLIFYSIRKKSWDLRTPEEIKSQNLK